MIRISTGLSKKTLCTDELGHRNVHSTALLSTKILSTIKQFRPVIMNIPETQHENCSYYQYVAEF